MCVIHLENQENVIGLKAFVQSCNLSKINHFIAKKVLPVRIWTDVTDLMRETESRQDST